MDWKALHDTRKSVPAEAGAYVMFSRILGGYVPVLWDGSVWRWINGEKIPDGIVRYWR